MMSAEGRVPRGVRAATVSLVFVTVTVAIGFIRVFDSPSFLVPLLGVVVAGHLLAALTRRVVAGVATLIMIGAGALVTIDATHFSSATAGMPTPFTFDAIWRSLQGSVDVLRHGVAPVAPDAGLLFAAAVALWIVAWSTDRLTFNYAAPIEAIVPSATVFVIITALSGPDHRWFSVGLYAGAVALHMLVTRHLTDRAGAPTRAGARRWRPILRGGAMAGCAIVIGLGAAATVPALAPDGLVPLRHGKTITVVSPLVDIRSRLVDQRDDKMFEVTAARPEYWRLMALDDFNGSTWSPPTSRVPEAKHFLATNDPRPSFTPLEAHFVLSGLGGTYAPTPFRASYASEPVDMSQPDSRPRLLWDAEYSTLIASGETHDVTDLAYTIEAAVPDVTKQQLQTDQGVVPAGIEQKYTELPDEFPADLADQAKAIVTEAHATTSYEKALALQSFFRDPSRFTYSTQIPSASRGESTNAIRSFLDNGVGFCEQFAGTYGAFARAVGLPTRIAVGFTWGTERDTKTDDRTFTVTGRNAHAWPEVYFAGLGWLPFEPTPGRGNPTASGYTNVDAAQDTSDATTPPPESTPGTTLPAATPDSTTPALPPPSSTPAPGAPSITSPPSSSSGPSTTIITALGALAVALVLAPTIRVLRRRWRWRAAISPAHRVRLAWTDTLRAWHGFDIARTAVDTDRDLGDRLARRLQRLVGSDAPSAQAHRLAELAGAAAWNSAGVTADDAEEATAAARRLSRIAHEHRSRWSRLIGWFDPRPSGVPVSDPR